MNFIKRCMISFALGLVVAKADSSKSSSSIIPNNLIIDLTNDCQDNYYVSIHLPYGTGSSDSRIILLRSIATFIRNCTINIIRPPYQYSCLHKCMTIVVIEFFSYKTPNATCVGIEGGIYMIAENQKFGDVCRDINENNEIEEHQMHTYVVPNRKFSVKMDFKYFSGTIKITATSGKLLGSHNNCTESEVFCILDGEFYCIDKLLECDGNFNCGTPGLFDEYCSNLSVEGNVLLMSIYGVCLMAVIIFFFIQILRVCVPTVADHFFVFQEGDEYKFVLTTQSLPPLVEKETETTKL